jgi:hypothetical protein
VTTGTVPVDARGLVAQLLAEALREAQGQPGVLVRDVPHLDAATVLHELAALIAQDIDLRIAYLDPSADPSAKKAGILDDIFTVKVEQAEAWRNMRDLDALIVVITEFDAAKLTSLEDFAPIGPGQLRRFLVERAATEFSEPNDVLPRWWTIIGSDEQISFSDLVDYYLALAPLQGTDLRDQTALQINRLGLLPDPAFFDGPSEKQLRKQLDDNRSVALRLANFSEEDRQKVDKALVAETDPDRRAELRKRLRDLQEYRRGGRLALTAADARQLLSIRSGPPPKSKSGDQPPDDQPPLRPPPKNLTALAVENLLRDDEADDDSADESLDNAVKELRGQLDDINDSTIRPEPVTVTLPSGFKVDEVVSTDAINMVNRLIGEGRYGGLVKSIGNDIAAMVRGFQQSAEVVRHFERARIDEFLTAFAAVSPSAADINDAFDRFDAARNALLPHLGDLCVAPLLVATAPTTSALVTPVIDAYREVVKATAKAYSDLHAEFGDDARAFIELLMLLDTVFLDNGSSLVALLTPLHPLLLWHYAEYAQVIQDQKNLLDDRDRALVRSEFETGECPSSLGRLASHGPCPTPRRQACRSPAGSEDCRTSALRPTPAIPKTGYVQSAGSSKHSSACTRLPPRAFASRSWNLLMPASSSPHAATLPTGRNFAARTSPCFAGDLASEPS